MYIYLIYNSNLQCVILKKLNILVLLLSDLVRSNNHIFEIPSMSSNSFAEATHTMQITARLTYGQDSNTRNESFDLIRDDISKKDLLRMALVYEKEMNEHMWKFVISKITNHTDAKMDRAKETREKIASEKNWDESNGEASSESSTETSKNPFELFKQASKKKEWGDYSDEEGVPAQAHPRAKENAPSPWVNAVSDSFPTLQSVQSNGFRKAHVKAPHRIKKGHTKPAESTDASNYKSERAGKNSSELYFFNVYTEDEIKDPKIRDRDWFLWKADDEGNPIGWREKGGWYTSRAKALFRHKKSNTGNTWIHQTYDTDTASWVTKDHKTYVCMVRDNTSHLH
jgi:hypothetical protein